MMEAARTSKTLINFYQTTRCYNPEDSNLHTHRRENLKSDFSRVKTPETCPGVGGSCSSETKHRIRTAPSPKLFVSAGILQKQIPQSRKTVLGSTPGKYVGFRDNNFFL
jgi:hypothetical protein